MGKPFWMYGEGKKMDFFFRVPNSSPVTLQRQGGQAPGAVGIRNLNMLFSQWITIFHLIRGCAPWVFKGSPCLRVTLWLSGNKGNKQISSVNRRRFKLQFGCRLLWWLLPGFFVLRCFGHPPAGSARLSALMLWTPSNSHKGNYLFPSPLKTPADWYLIMCREAYDWEPNTWLIGLFANVSECNFTA